MLATKIGYALDFLLGHLQEDGGYGADASDLAASYKSPMLFFRKGMAEEADRVLNHIKRRFLMANGDFGVEGVKTADPVLSQYGSYLNGWIAMAAQRMGRFDIAYPASRYLDGFYREGRFATLRPGDSESDILTVSHLGLHALYTGQVEKALAAGLALEKAFDQQRDSRDFFLRFTADGPVTEFAEEATCDVTLHTLFYRDRATWVKIEVVEKSRNQAV